MATVQLFWPKVGLTALVAAATHRPLLSVFAHLDFNSSGELDLKEFLVIAARDDPAAEACISAVFHAADSDKDGRHIEQS